MVVDACKLHLAGVSETLANSRVSVVIGDGVEYLKSVERKFDVIFTDSGDPFGIAVEIRDVGISSSRTVHTLSYLLGPATSLFGKDYYQLIKSHLNSNGALASQGKLRFLKGTVCNLKLAKFLANSAHLGESLWLDLDFIRRMFDFLSTLFPCVH